jgi:hypothetical protein
MSDAGSKKSSMFWNSEKKRPSNLVILIIIGLTLIFLVSGILSTLAKFNELRVIVDCDGYYQGNIEWIDTDNWIEEGKGKRIFTFHVRLKTAVTITVERADYSSSSSYFTLEIYDNDILIEERSGDRLNHIRILHVMGDN